MATYTRKQPFQETEQGQLAQETLVQMAEDQAYHTPSSYSANATLYPDNLMPFVDKHMEYMRSHPTMDTQHYLSNLRLMTKIS